MSKFKEFTDKELEEEISKRATIQHIVEEIESIDNQVKDKQRRLVELQAHLDRLNRD